MKQSILFPEKILHAHTKKELQTKPRRDFSHFYVLFTVYVSTFTAEIFIVM